MSVPPPASAPANEVESARRRRAGRRLLWLLLGVLAGVALLVVGGTYLVWLLQGRRALRREVAVASEANEPLTTAEITAYCQVPPGQRDITKEWLAALQPFNGWVRQMPQHADLSNLQVPPLAQTLRDEAGLRKLLTKMQADLDGLHAVALEEGMVSFPHDYREGAVMLLTEADLLNGADHALQLEFLLLARAEDAPGVRRNLATRLRMADTLARLPILVTLLIRQRLHVLMLRDLHQFVGAQRDLTDADLALFQQMIRRIDYRDHLERTLIGQRAMLYQAFHYRFADDMQLMKAAEQSPLETTDNLQNIRRPEDCALSLRLINELIAANRQPHPALLDAAEKLVQEVDQLEEADALVRWRYRQTLVMFEHRGAYVGHIAADAYRDLVDVALALRWYELRHGRLPDDLSRLAPEFLPAVPNDPFDGQPLKKQAADGVVTIYSVGVDRADDGGHCTVPLLSPDIAVVVAEPE